MHKSSFIHNNSSGGLLKEVLKQLVSVGILLCCSRGVKNSSRSTAVFIKKLPSQDDFDVEQDLIHLLSKFSTDEEVLTIATYRESCKHITLEAIGIVQKEVFDILLQPEYGIHDLSTLTKNSPTNFDPCKAFARLSSNNFIANN